MYVIARFHYDLPGREMPASSSRSGMSAIDLGTSTSFGSDDTEIAYKKINERLAFAGH